MTHLSVCKPDRFQAWRKEGEPWEGSSWSDARFEDEAEKSIQ